MALPVERKQASNNNNSLNRNHNTSTTHEVHSQPPPQQQLQQQSVEQQYQGLPTWTKECILGSGAFGIITLWRNQSTGQRLTLKQCKFSQTGPSAAPISAKTRERWRQEVAIMNRLDHPNIVRTLPVPACLESPAAVVQAIASSSSLTPMTFEPMPSLGMEYCAAGDLRKVMSRPENCCGLPEGQIQEVFSDISEAILYLHGMRIIHRDLKPENVVLQTAEGGAGGYVYKLIDLGYAKEWDESSLCFSFVGTLQYLAPELFVDRQYTSAVDNWSFGVLMHELITNRRPFLPHMTPAEWIPIVKRKRPEDICAIYDQLEKKIIFSKEICQFNQISGLFKAEMELWLRTALEWEPKKRGGKGTFQRVAQMLGKLVVKCFLVHSLETFMYELTSDMSVSDLQVLIQSNTKIDLSDQLLLMPLGTGAHQKVYFDKEITDDLLKKLMSRRRATSTGTRKQRRWEIVELFVWRRSERLKYSAYSVSCSIPSSVETVLLNPTRLVTYEVLKNCWKQFIWVGQKITGQYAQLARAHGCLTKYTTGRSKAVVETVNHLKYNYGQLLAVNNFFRAQMRIDLSNLKRTSFSPDEQIEILFMGICKDILAAMKQCKKLVKYLKPCPSASVLTVEGEDIYFNYDPFVPYVILADTSDPDSSHVIVEYRDMLSIYENIRKKNREEKQRQIQQCGNSNAFSNTPMVKVLCDIFQQVEKLMKRCMNVMNENIEYTVTLVNVGVQLKRVKDKFSDRDERVKELHSKYEHSLWALFEENQSKHPIVQRHEEELRRSEINDIMEALDGVDLNLEAVQEEFAPVEPSADTSGGSSPSIPSDWSLLA